MKTRWLVVALAVSLALNIAVLGFAIGTASGGIPRLARPSFDPTAGIGRLLRFLPEERREAVVDRAARRQVRESLRQLRAAQRDVTDALAREPFDANALNTALERFREQFAASQMGSHAALVDISGKLTPEERALLVKTTRSKRDARPQRDRPPPGQR